MPTWNSKTVWVLLIGILYLFPVNQIKGLERAWERIKRCVRFDPYLQYKDLVNLRNIKNNLFFVPPSSLSTKSPSFGSFVRTEIERKKESPISTTSFNKDGGGRRRSATNGGAGKGAPRHSHLLRFVIFPRRALSPQEILRRRRINQPPTLHPPPLRQTSRSKALRQGISLFFIFIDRMNLIKKEKKFKSCCCWGAAGGGSATSKMHACRWGHFLFPSLQTSRSIFLFDPLFFLLKWFWLIPFSFSLLQDAL